MSDPVLWRLGLVEVRWHDLWHALSLAAGLLAATLCARLGGLPWALWRDTLLWTLPEALLAARVGHVAMHLNTYLLVPLQVWQVWDGGYALGALLAGMLADALGLEWTIAAIAGLTFASGAVVVGRMYETLGAPQVGAR